MKGHGDSSESKPSKFHGPDGIPQRGREAGLLPWPLGFPVFLIYFAYIQAISALAFVLLLLGVQCPSGTVCGHFVAVLGTRFAHTSTSQLVLDDTKAPVIFLSNHRSWGDFWADCALLGGPSFVARWLVALAIPCTAMWGGLTGWLWFFHRRAVHREGTTHWTENFWRRSHQGYRNKGVVVYPEGSRSLSPEGLPLKPGGLVAAYRLGWPVQVVITTNKEFVMAERSLSVGLGTLCVTSVSRPIRPAEWATSDAFIGEVKAVWRETWADAFSSLQPLATSKALRLRPCPLLPGASLEGVHFQLPFQGSWPLVVLRLGTLFLLTRRILSHV